MPQVRGNTDPLEVYDYILAQKGGLAFDIGANGGFLAEEISPHFDKVIAVEPCAESFDHLHSKWEIENIVPLQVAVSDHDGTVTLGVKKLTNQWGELFTGDTLKHWGETFDTRTVPCVTLDSLARSFGMPDFVKIDTEGHECQIVDGGHKVFESLPKFCIEIHGTEYGDYIMAYLDSIELPYKVLRHPGYLVDNLPEDFKGDFFRHFWLVG